MRASAVYGLLARAAVKKAADQRTAAQRSSAHASGFLFCRLPPCRVRSECSALSRSAAPRARYRVGVPSSTAIRTADFSAAARPPVAAPTKERESQPGCSRKRERERTLRLSRRSIAWPRFVLLRLCFPTYSCRVCVRVRAESRVSLYVIAQ